MSLPSLYPAKMKKLKALIVDDQLSIRLALTHFLRGRGYDVEEAETGEVGVAIARTFLPEIVFLDRRLPDCEGEEIIKHFASPEIGALVVMMTAYVDLDKAIVAMRNGADYYFPKPLDLEHVGVILEKLEEKIKLTAEVGYFRRAKEVWGNNNLIGESPEIIKVQRLAALLARNVNTPVLILGESGSGKEVVAKSIHMHSGNKGQMVEVNCASLSETLLESELFGHEKGAFTDAKETKKGLFEIADGGTIFFDELAEMPLSIQAKLLKVLDSKRFRRVGGVSDIETSARFMAATNRDLSLMVKTGLFREDLFYRISVFPIHIPPLRDRGRDVTILACYFASRISEDMGKGKWLISPETLRCLQQYNWPGNVRELKNVIERALILSANGEILPDYLPAEINQKYSEPASFSGFSGLRPLSEIRDEYIEYVLKITGNNHSRTAAILGISRSTLLAGLKRKQ